MPSVSPPPGSDAYEPDDTCVQARPIATDGSVQAHTFHTAGDEDWAAFQAVGDTHYLIETITPADSRADVVLELYDACNAVALRTQNNSFSPDVRLEFEAPAGGTYYLRLTDFDPAAGSSERTYRLSVRRLSQESQPGALVLVAGRLKINDPLQANIYDVTDAAYRLFVQHGYTGDRIFYLAAAQWDADGDGFSDVDGMPGRGNLEYAIEQWVVERVGSGRPFTLYVMDHGNYDLFYLNGSSPTVRPDEISVWLNELEAAVPGVKVNVILESCFSGSFIDLAQSVSKPGRVVMSSAGAYTPAYASQNGAVFSDALVAALGRGMSLYSGFTEGQAATLASHPNQTPWLDDDGDGRPNEAEDGQVAQHRGFGYVGTLADTQWPPYIVWARGPE